MKDSTNVSAQDNQVVTLNIVCIQEPIQNSTINFLAPVLFNFENKTLAQVVLENQKYENFGLAEPISKFLISHSNNSLNENLNPCWLWQWQKP